MTWVLLRSNPALSAYTGENMNLWIMQILILREHPLEENGLAMTYVFQRIKQITIGTSI